MVTAELAPATAEEARALTDQIKVAVEGTWQLIQRAYLTRTWAALGYSSWDDYCTREFGTSRLRLPREERQEVVSSLREIGMSTRAIAAATGIARNTVRGELRQVGQTDPPEPTGQPSSPEPDAPAPLRAVPDLPRVEASEPAEQRHPEPKPARRITGTDGKSYAAQPERAPNRPALPPQFQSAAADIGRVIGRLEKLTTDDRFKANRASISDLCVPEFRRACQVLQDLLDVLGDEDDDPDQ